MIQTRSNAREMPGRTASAVTSGGRIADGFPSTAAGRTRMTRSASRNAVQMGFPWRKFWSIATGSVATRSQLSFPPSLASDWSTAISVPREQGD
ncbi:hypothetical protein BRD15_05075 [Halobacteriales archaeon SW_6_65_15]|nr:MAG: hypothetical protein BRD15_05075 [Halobacteriales archaeon SW_6_65_15]